MFIYHSVIKSVFPFPFSPSQLSETLRQKIEVIFIHLCLSDLSLRFSPVQGVEMVNGALRGRPRVGEDLEDVKIMAQGVSSDQQHSCREDTDSQQY